MIFRTRLIGTSSSRTARAFCIHLSFVCNYTRRTRHTHTQHTRQARNSGYVVRAMHSVRDVACVVPPYLAYAGARVDGVALELAQHGSAGVEGLVLVDEPLQAVQRMRLEGRQRGGQLLRQLPPLLLRLVVRVLILWIPVDGSE